MREPHIVVNIDFLCINNICWIITDLKDDITDIHHWGCMCYVLCNIDILRDPKKSANFGQPWPTAEEVAQPLKIFFFAG